MNRRGMLPIITPAAFDAECGSSGSCWRVTAGVIRGAISQGPECASEIFKVRVLSRAPIKLTSYDTFLLFVLASRHARMRSFLRACAAQYSFYLEPPGIRASSGGTGMRRQFPRLRANAARRTLAGSAASRWLRQATKPSGRTNEAPLLEMP